MVLRSTNITIICLENMDHRGRLPPLYQRVGYKTVLYTIIKVRALISWVDMGVTGPEGILLFCSEQISNRASNARFECPS